MTTKPTKQEKAWARSAALVRRMFDLGGRFAPSIRCPFCDNIPHMMGTVFGRNVPPDSTSGAGLIIQYVCESGHEWQLRFADHSGGTHLSIRETDNFYHCEECGDFHLKQRPPE